jgi:two-component system chemotaxis response regulator CheB
VSDHSFNEPLFSEAEIEFVFELATKITGNCHSGSYRKNILVSNVHRRMLATQLPDLHTYVNYAHGNQDEYHALVSALTIHTTNWFREKPQFDQLYRYFLDKAASFRNTTIKIACTACSTGEEVYTIAMYMEDLRFQIPGFDYRIYATDIDPVSISTGTRAIYSDAAIKQIPDQYLKYIMRGTGKTAGLMTLKKTIRERCEFSVKNITDFRPSEGPFDVVTCRNVLIYFTPHDIEKIVRNFVGSLKPDGLLCLGHSETIDAKTFNFIRMGHAIYKYSKHSLTSMKATKRKVLIIDDSVTVRKMIEKNLTDAGFTTFSVESASEASEFLTSNQVDIISLDLHMPGESGDIWLRNQRRAGLKTPAIILSDLSPSQIPEILGYLMRDAQEYIEKKDLRKDPEGTSAKFLAILESSEMNLKPDSAKETINLKSTQKLRKADLILFGASTGGTRALAKVLENTPTNCPPIVVVQHMGLEFLRPFAQTLAKSAGLTLGEAEDGAPLKRGHIYLSTQDAHIGVKTKSPRDETLVLQVERSDLVTGHRPSVNYLFQSAAKLPHSIAAFLLTGMGKDGAQGLVALKDQGAMTFAQDQSSCIVFGMPKEAIALGGASYVGNLDEIKLKLEHIISISFDYKAAG